jgi:ubiquinone biosynthesis protein
MSGSLFNTLRLMRAGLVLAQHGVRFVPKGVPVPLPLKIARALTWPIRALSPEEPQAARVADALTALGPSYVKLGQFLATRADVIGDELSNDLRNLQDKAEPFAMEEAREAIERALGGRLEDHFVEFGPPVAAASIAQVHKATVMDGGIKKTVAVKILRPNIERRFYRDLDSYYFAARLIERFYPPARRLKPVAVVDNLKHTTDLEMDLRLEAAAMSEMAENIKDDAEAFRIPGVDWRRTAKRVLTVEWVDGTPISHVDTLRKKGFDTQKIGLRVLRAFLRQAMRDGFFHADMHQGNLLVDDNGEIIAVDFGIMGRLGLTERRFLAEILHGLITRDYHRAAAIHFEAGYVPSHHTVAEFAQAMRAIGEPIHGRTAEEISMADLLGQLFAYTELFDMQTRPELILLQKSMVIVEGVARDLDPTLNVWIAAEPVAREWIENNLSPLGRLREAGRGAGEIGDIVMRAPALFRRAEEALHGLAEYTKTGVRLDDQSLERIAEERRRTQRPMLVALWITAISLAVIAYKYYFRMF